MKKWNLNSWKNYPAKHLPEYRDKKELDLVLNKIKNYPPLESSLNEMDLMMSSSFSKQLNDTYNKLNQSNF